MSFRPGVSEKAVLDAIDGIPTDNKMQALMKKDICGLMESFLRIRQRPVKKRAGGLVWKCNMISS